MMKTYDVVLVGTGIMSATLAALLHELHPSLSILIIEKLPAPALESSNGFNNAGTGHSGFCELNYTTFKDGVVDISKAVEVNKAFLQSKQFWEHLVSLGVLKPNFINRVPHMSFVVGIEDVFVLEKRYEALKKHFLFSDMQFSSSFQEIKEWAPLIMEGSNETDKVAATRVEKGTDVDFGNLTRQLIKHAATFADIAYNAELKDIKKSGEFWDLSVNGYNVICKYVFVGAGGAALPLLQKSGIPEIDGYGGFPVSGQWLICNNKEVIKRHDAKVYGKAAVGSPPMSVPHLDTRIVNGEKHLMFGPYAGFSTKFLKKGNFFDLFKSINLKNIGTMLKAGLSNFGLTKYLVSEVLKTKYEKFEILKSYYPNAKKEDWKLFTAGQRVQVIKKKNGKAVIEFGTEVVGSSDGTIIGLLGASPGASTAVHIMLDVINKMNLPTEGKKLSDIITPEITESNYHVIERNASIILNLVD